MSTSASMRTARGHGEDARPPALGGRTPALRARQLVHRRTARSPEDAADRVTAYVYGNVLVMATLISLRPDDLLGPTAVLSLLGVGLSTAVAHLVAHAVGGRIRHGRPSRWADVRRG